MNYVNICPTCKESISKTPLVDTLVTYREDLTQNEIYEQGWHKKCYPPAPAFLAAAETALIEMVAMGNRDNWDFVTQAYADAIGGLRAAVADEVARRGQARGEPEEPYLANYDYSGDMRKE